jgi:type IV pilus assembly protein PilY1
MSFTIHRRRIPRCLAACMAICLAVIDGTCSATTPETKISDTPLYGAHASIRPNMVLSLSVEFPTVGVAYRDGSYKKATEYVGYFNPHKCYIYNGGDRNLTDGYFVSASNADASTHECDGKSFSGNFMNWAASSAIDMMRYAMTGGDRIIDTEVQTILQRAVIPDFFYADDSFFPRRSLTVSESASAPGKVTPFDVPTLYVVSCLNYVFFGKVISEEGNCFAPAFKNNNKNKGNDNADSNMNNADKALGEYLVRVQVCDTNEGTSRSDLCKRYGTHYKPVGEMQKNADKIRFSVMGYLNNDFMNRYGGVLRAPMKYVGATKFTQPGFTESTNERQEWDPLTGIFLQNPESATIDASVDTSSGNVIINSGVVNYLNKFGRGGEYKINDPVGELYYEGIRYLQGLQPTPEAINDMSSNTQTEKIGDLRLNFPVLKTWEDPIVASCQRNFIVSIADVNTHFDRYIPGNTRTTPLSNGEPPLDSKRDATTSPDLDVIVWTNKVGEMEADTSAAYGNTDTHTRPWLANLSALDTGSDGHGSYYMAGLAYWANTHDIRLDKPTRVQTYVIDVDEQGNGQMDYNTRRIQPRDSQLYLAAKYGGFKDDGTGNPFDGVDVQPEAPRDKKWDSDGDGIPDNYFLAGKPQTLIDSIHKIFDQVANFSGTTSGIAASGTRVLGAGAFIYQPGFNATRWSGSLKSLKVTIDANGDIQVASKHTWDAGEVLTEKDTEPSPGNRRIYTAYTDTSVGSRSFETIKFDWTDLKAIQRPLIDTNPVTNKDDGMGEQRVAYLRGVRTLEEINGGTFRNRDRVLGDIIHSNPVYVGAPSLQMSGAGYDAFYEANKGRKPTVYIGANDGMLHAFAASDGTELFAYVPEMLLSQVNRLTSPTYTHQPYVDGAIAFAEAKLGDDWKTVLVSGLGDSAQGVFALDITNPLTFGDANKALWEFTDSDDADMGNLVGTPVIAKFKTGTTDAGVVQYRYFAVIASGFNNYRDDGIGKFNKDAPGALFLLALDKSASDIWKQGVNYFKFVMPISDASLQNGLSPPALVVDSDGAVRYAYAGDLQGNLWRLDFSGGKPWSNALGSAPYKPLFIAKDSSTNTRRQPITTQPRVVFGPGGYVVLFGTGKFVEDIDAAPGNFKPQSFYAVLDTLRDEDKLNDRSKLVRRFATKQNATDTTLTITGDEFTYGTAVGTYQGWYLDFLNAETTGERSVTNPLAVYGRIFFNTLIPGSDPCAVGSGRSYSLDALSGLPIAGETTGGLSTIGFLGSPMLMEAGATDLSDRNAIGRRIAGRTYSIVNSGTGNANAKTLENVNKGGAALPAGRFSWREILNWQELRKALSTPASTTN